MSTIFTYRNGRMNAAQIYKGGLDAPFYQVDFTDGLVSGVSISSAATTAVNSSNGTVTSECVSTSTTSGAVVTVKMLTCGSGGTGEADDNAQFRLRTTATLSSGGPLAYDVFILVSNKVYSPS